MTIRGQPRAKEPWAPAGAKGTSGNGIQMTQPPLPDRRAVGGQKRKWNDGRQFDFGPVRAIAEEQGPEGWVLV